MSNIRPTTIGRTGGIACMALTFILFCHAATVSAQTRCWTTVGSAGTVDEEDLSIVALDSSDAAVKGAVTDATVDVRYNVVAVDGVFGGEGRHLTVRFADNGAAAQVIVRLQQLNISSGVKTQLVELNSNDFAPSTVAQKQSKPFRPGFDFQKNIYYIEVKLMKTGVGGNPLIRAIQICGGLIF